MEHAANGDHRAPQGAGDGDAGAAAENGDRAAVPRLSIIVPALNEARSLASTLRRLLPMRGRAAEVIVVDGGSNDATVSEAMSGADQVLVAKRGRASQMNAGARLARGSVLLFLHADTILPSRADTMLESGLELSGRNWGRFDVRLPGSRWPLRMIASMMNWRSRMTGIATGDQGIFVRRSVFEAVGGYPEIALMEDIALCTALRKFGRPLCLRGPIETSSRRWDKGGVFRTIVLMWSLRLAFFFGADPARLARIYHGR